MPEPTTGRRWPAITLAAVMAAALAVVVTVFAVRAVEGMSPTDTVTGVMVCVVSALGALAAWRHAAEPTDQF